MKRTSVTRKMALILAAIVLMTASGCGRRENADKEDNNIIRNGIARCAYA